jgi:hypothetical protein
MQLPPMHGSLTTECLGNCPIATKLHAVTYAAAGDAQPLVTYCFNCSRGGLTEEKWSQPLSSLFDQGLKAYRMHTSNNHYASRDYRHWVCLPFK